MMIDLVTMMKIMFQTLNKTNQIKTISDKPLRNIDCLMNHLYSYKWKKDRKYLKRKSLKELKKYRIMQNNYIPQSKRYSLYREKGKMNGLRLKNN